MFSIYTNGEQLFSSKKFGSSSGVIECLDGIRSLSIMWVVFNHVRRTYVAKPVQNLKTVEKVNGNFGIYVFRYLSNETFSFIFII